MILKTFERERAFTEWGIHHCVIERVQLERHDDGVERQVIVACLANAWSGTTEAQAKQNARRQRDRQLNHERQVAEGRELQRLARLARGVQP